MDGYINIKDAVKLGVWFGWPYIDCWITPLNLIYFFKKVVEKR